jgi:hypothetical protein
VLDYDKYLNQNKEALPNILKSKEESAPSYLFNTYWLNYWSSTNLKYRYIHNKNIQNQLTNSYLPLVVNYSEYDFRN